jgi:hypothetical protein
MFVQVIQGRVRDKEGLRSQMNKWDRELKPGATGFLGSTAGVADNGTFVAVARFASEEDARRNSDRPEQGRWWEDTALHLEPDVTFQDCTDVETILGGGSDDAGFVQVMMGRCNDVEKARSLGREMEAELKDRRPDLIGIVVVMNPDGRFTQLAYFPSEDEARRGEQASQGPPEEWSSLFEDVTYVDLRDPLLVSP